MPRSKRSFSHFRLRRRRSPVRVFRQRKIDVLEIIRRHYRELKEAKKFEGRVSDRLRELVARLRRMIYTERKLDFRGWSLPQVMAYLFLVNGEFHRTEDNSPWKRLKDRAQLHVLVEYPENISSVACGHYSNCYEISCGIWQSHWRRDDADHPANRFLVDHPERIPWKKTVR